MTEDERTFLRNLFGPPKPELPQPETGTTNSNTMREFAAQLFTNTNKEN